MLRALRLATALASSVSLASLAIAQTPPGSINIRDGSGTSRADFNITVPNEWTFYGPINNVTEIGVGYFPTFVPNGSAIYYYADSGSTRYDLQCGLLPGPATACADATAAYNAMCTNNNFSGGGIPTIVLGKNASSTQTFTRGLKLGEGSPVCQGAPMIMLDLCGSIINVTNDTGVYDRFNPARIRINSSCGPNGVPQNGLIEASITGGGTAHLLEARGGSNFIELLGHITLGPVGAGMSQILTDEDGDFETVPSSVDSSAVGNVIAGSGGNMIQTLSGGNVHLEGQTWTIGKNPDGTTISYTTGIMNSVDGGIITMFGLNWAGYNVNGQQYVVNKGGILDTNAQPVSGQTTNTYTACAGNSYLPGSQCGQYVGPGPGVMSDPGLPTALAGSGTTLGSDAYIQGTDTSFFVSAGSSANGLTNVNNTQYSIVVTLATFSNFGACTVTPNNSTYANVSFANYSSPTTTPVVSNGQVQIYWKGTGASLPVGSGWRVTCS